MVKATVSPLEKGVSRYKTACEGINFHREPVKLTAYYLRNFVNTAVHYRNTY